MSKEAKVRLLNATENYKETYKSWMTASFKNYDSVIMSLKEDWEEAESEDIIWWDEYDGGFRAAGERVEIEIVCQYQNGISFKVRETNGPSFYMHFADRNESLKEYRAHEKAKQTNKNV